MPDTMLARLIEVAKTQEVFNEQLRGRIVDLECEVSVLRIAFVHVAKTGDGEQAEAAKELLRYYVAHSSRPSPDEPHAAAATSAAKDLLRLLAIKL